MRLRDRYSRLTFWNKLAVWGTVTGLVSFCAWVIDSSQKVWNSLALPIAVEDVVYQPDSYVYPGVSDKRSAQWLTANAEGIPTTPFMEFSVASKASQRQVQLAPYLVVNVLDVVPMPRRTVSVYNGERGDGGGIRYFRGSLIPAKGLAAAPNVRADQDGFESYDYYKLSPGEVEQMALYLKYEPGYIYTFRVGVQYRYKRRNSVAWLPRTYKIGVPAGPAPLHIFDGESKIEMNPDYMEPGNAHAWRDSTAAFLHRKRMFTLSQISADQ